MDVLEPWNTFASDGVFVVDAGSAQATSTVGPSKGGCREPSS